PGSLYARGRWTLSRQCMGSIEACVGWTRRAWLDRGFPPFAAACGRCSLWSSPGHPGRGVLRTVCDPFGGRVARPEERRAWPHARSTTPILGVPPAGAEQSLVGWLEAAAGSEQIQGI